MKKAEIVAAIRRAAQELGRVPSRGELKRLTGLSHYRVLCQFRTLREAIRAAGLEPNPKGERIGTDELIRDWERVQKKLGRRPSRAEYVREGRYSAGTLSGRFGSWSAIGNTHHGDTEARRKGRVSRELTRKARINRKQPRVMESRDKAIMFQWASQLARVPGPLEGKRRVTEAVAAMIVNTLVPANGNWQLAIGQTQNPFTTEGTEKRRGGTGNMMDRIFPLRSFASSSLVRKDRPVMGPPFSRHPLTNAPVNEMGVVFLFALAAWDLGFQVESLWGRYPDGRAKREVAPGKWQDVWIEFEYESKNFVLHGHDPKKCDVIVCWRHNWVGAPAELDIIELSKLLAWS